MGNEIFMFNAYRKFTKPKLKKKEFSGYSWCCDGMGYVGLGNSPKEAYGNWERMLSLNWKWSN